MFINPQSDYYSMFKVNNPLNSGQGIDVSLFYFKIRSLTKTNSLDSKQEIIAIISELNPAEPKILLIHFPM